MIDVDTVAEAIWLAQPGVSGINTRRWRGGYPTDATRDHYRRMAQAGIDALGLTEEWRGAHSTWLRNSRGEKVDTVQYVGAVDEDQARSFAEGKRWHAEQRLVSAWVRVEEQS